MIARSTKHLQIYPHQGSDGRNFIACPKCGRRTFADRTYCPGGKVKRFLFFWERKVGCWKNGGLEHIHGYDYQCEGRWIEPCEDFRG